MNAIELKETMTSDNTKLSSDNSSAKIPQDSSNSSNEEVRSVRSYTVDDRGILNNVAVMPKMYIEEDTSNPKSFKFQIIGLIVLVIATIGIAIAVS
jgi:subtilase family serine protease